MALSRSLALYGCVSLLALVVAIAETLKYAHQLHHAYHQLTALDIDSHDTLTSSSSSSSDATSSSSLPSSSVNITLPLSPFETFSSVLSSIPYLLTVTPSSTLSPHLLLAFFVRSKINSLISLNLLISSLTLLTSHTQSSLFGPLSDNERKACRENLFNFLVFRSVFIAAVVPLDVRELCVWTSFFAIIAALRLLCIIARERFSTVTILPSATTDTFVRLLLLIGGILVIDLLLACVVWWLVRADGLSVASLLLFENGVVLLGCLKVSGKYCIHLLSLRRDSAWEERTAYLYYCEFVFECVTQLLTMLHYLHVWALYGLSVTIIDLFLFLHLRSSFVVLVDRISKYHHYRRASVEINSRYADATPQELQQADDSCAICREPMDSAKKLPSAHTTLTPPPHRCRRPTPR